MRENDRPKTGKWIAALAFAVVALMSPWQGSLAAEEPRDPSAPLVQVAPADGGIVIDGKMDEALWREVPVLGPFVNFRGDGYPVAQTEARITRTDKALVIFLRCHEPTMDKLRVAAGKGPFDDDHIEVFVQGTEKEGDFFQFVANSRGDRIQMATGNQWDGAWGAAGGTFEGGWTLEIALPFATLGRDPGKLDPLRLNVCRDRPHARELSSWSSPRGGGFRKISRFGEIRFVAHLPLQWSVLPPSLGDDAAPLIDLTCKPVAAKNVENPLLNRPEFTATVQTYSENIPVAASEQKATFLLGEHRTLRLPFAPPPGSKPSVSITLRDSSGSEVLATSNFPIAVSDPRREFMRQIHASIEELKSAHVPKQFAERLEAWRKAAAVSTGQTDVEQLRTLAQALRSVSLAARLSDADTVAATTFVLPTFTKTAYDQIPERTGQPLACSVFRGETESMSVNVFAFRDLADVTVAVDDLKSGTATLAASALDVRLVMNWWQSSSDNFASTTPVLVPEMLVKDDAMVTLDMARQRNVFNFDPRIGPEDPAQLRPFTIPEFHNRQVLLTLRTPEKQPPGVYTGRVVVSAGGKPVATVPCTVTVLPVTWEATHGAFSAYSYTTLDERFEFADEPTRQFFHSTYWRTVLSKIREPEGEFPRRWITPGSQYHGQFAYRAQYIWDTLFMLDPLCLLPGQTEVVREVLRNFWEYQDAWDAIAPEHAHGMIHHGFRPADFLPKKFAGKTCIPWLAWGVERIFNHTGDETMAREALPHLERYHDWWWRERDLDGIVSSDVNERYCCDTGRPLGASDCGLPACVLSMVYDGLTRHYGATIRKR